MRHDPRQAPLFNAGAQTAPPADPHIHPDDVRRVTGQNRRVLDLLEAGGEITFREAEAVGVHRLAARIHDLKAFGYRIDSRRVGERKCEAYRLATRRKDV